MHPNSTFSVHKTKQHMIVLGSGSQLQVGNRDKDRNMCLYLSKSYVWIGQHLQPMHRQCTHMPYLTQKCQGRHYVAFEWRWTCMGGSNFMSTKSNWKIILGGFPLSLRTNFVTKIDEHVLCFKPFGFFVLKPNLSHKYELSLTNKLRLSKFGF